MCTVSFPLQIYLQNTELIFQRSIKHKFISTAVILHIKEELHVMLLKCEKQLTMKFLFWIYNIHQNKGVKHKDHCIHMATSPMSFLEQKSQISNIHNKKQNHNAIKPLYTHSFPYQHPLKISQIKRC